MIKTATSFGKDYYVSVIEKDLQTFKEAMTSRDAPL